MPSKIISPFEFNGQDLTGDRYGRLTVINFLYVKYQRNGQRNAVWRCRCDCGNIVPVIGKSLRSYFTKSCGCITRDHVWKAIKHGHAAPGKHTKTYKVWDAMKRRCLNKQNPQFKNYGGRGIRVCRRWLTFNNFLLDMGESPEGMTLERIDVNGHYEPRNCKWATRKEQAQNKRNNVKLTYFGKTQVASEWARQLGMNPGLICNRKRNGWSDEKSLTTPVNRRK